MEILKISHHNRPFSMAKMVFFSKFVMTIFLRLQVIFLTTSIPGPLLCILCTEITQLVVVACHNKLCAASGSTRSEAGSEGQPNIDCWPRGPAKACRPRNEAYLKVNNFLLNIFPSVSDVSDPCVFLMFLTPVCLYVSDPCLLEDIIKVVY